MKRCETERNFTPAQRGVKSNLVGVSTRKDTSLASRWMTHSKAEPTVCITRRYRPEMGPAYAERSVPEGILNTPECSDPEVTEGDAWCRREGQPRHEADAGGPREAARDYLRWLLGRKHRGVESAAATGPTVGFPDQLLDPAAKIDSSWQSSAPCLKASRGTRPRAVRRTGQA